MKLIISIILVVFSSPLSAQQNSEAPSDSRFELISVGGFTSLEAQLNRYEDILSLAGREITRVDLENRNYYNQYKTASVIHASSRDISCIWESVEVYTSFNGRLDQKVLNDLRIRRIPTASLIDVEIISTFGTGKIAGVRLYFCR